MQLANSKLIFTWNMNLGSSEFESLEQLVSNDSLARLRDMLEPVKDGTYELLSGNERQQSYDRTAYEETFSRLWHMVRDGSFANWTAGTGSVGLTWLVALEDVATQNRSIQVIVDASVRTRVRNGTILERCDVNHELKKVLHFGSQFGSHSVW